MGSRQRRKYADLSKPRTHWDLTVELPEVGLRLDQFLKKRCDWMSRERLQRLIGQGRIRLNGEVRKASTRTRHRDRVRIDIEPPKDVVDPSRIPLDVLHQDDQLLVLNKQPGIVVHPVGMHQLHNLLAALHARFRRPDDPDLDRVPHVCHRIDKDTSGVFLVAFDERSKAHVSIQFERRTVQKEYRAIVHGCPSPAQGVVDAPIRFDAEARPSMSIHPDGQPSQTSYEVEEAFEDAALVRFRPRTGRTHQIRLHSAHLGHPLVCDETYGGRMTVGGMTEEEMPLDRCALHSSALRVRHPDGDRLVEFRAPLAEDMSALLQRLRDGRDA